MTIRTLPPLLQIIVLSLAMMIPVIAVTHELKGKDPLLQHKGAGAQAANSLYSGDYSI